MTESEFIVLLRGIAGSAAARGLVDDVAVLETAGASLVLTHDMIVEGVHFLASDPPGDVAWKLVAVNLSDLAGKGARPVGLLLGFTLAGDDDWDRAFVRGLGEASRHFAAPLLGGDTVALGAAGPRVLGLTAIGESLRAPSRAGAQAGDILWVTGAIGDGGAGLRAAEGALDAPVLLRRFRRPQPRIAAGQALAPLAHAMMDVSDGLLIDAARLAEASGLAAEIALDTVPLSPHYRRAVGDDRPARLAAVTAGDDYELLFTAAPAAGPAIGAAARELGLPITPIGRVAEGTGLRLTDAGAEIALPARLGYEHRPA